MYTVHEDSALITAVEQGHVLMVDEADKAPREVVCVLKGLVVAIWYRPLPANLLVEVKGTHQALRAAPPRWQTHCIA